MKRLIRYLKEYRKECIIGPAFKLLEAIFELSIPIVMMNILRRVNEYATWDPNALTEAQKAVTKAPSSPTLYIIGMGFVLLLLGAIGLACALTAQYFAAKAATGMATSLRRDMFQQINYLSYNELDKIGTSTLISRMINDVNQVQTALNLTLRLVLRSPFVVFGAMIMAFTIQGDMGVIFILVIAVLSVIVFGIMLKTLPIMKSTQKQFDKVLLSTRENLAGVRVVRAFNREEDEKNSYYAESNRLMGFQRATAKWTALMNPLTYAVVNLGILVILAWGQNKVNATTATIDAASLIALVQYMSMILAELVKLANLIITLTRSVACGQRIVEVLELSSSIKDDNTYPASPAANAPKIEFRDVSMKYVDAEEDALSKISFKIQKGEMVGIIGGTGSGKSTLVNMIPRFYDASEGIILIDGRDIGGYPLKQLRNKVGIVPQQPTLFKGTIRDNILWGSPGATDREINEALRVAQATNIVEEKQEKLDFMVEQGGRNLSGGQRQRLTIARALVRRPEILIMDDSASALDFLTESNLRKAIREDRKNMTMLIVTQRVASIMDADRIIVMDDGAVIGMGTHGELLETCEAYREICASQLTVEEV
ncbi:MAG: ABC transporter ATP-binding protein [Lachnospiraceae bacterium]|nr:ABC transporter ATP-binding protein [Lachnospiraceae bacterium]